MSEPTLRDISNELTNIQAQIQGMGVRFDNMDSRFDKMDDRFDKMDDRFDKMDDRFDRMDGRFDGTDDRFDRMDAELFSLKTYVMEDVATKSELASAKNELMTHIDGVYKRTENLDHEMVSSRARTERLEGRVEYLEGKG